ncbi:unnamed protein product [Spirodela intermedia]|uniref:Uncharacterized protein n=1 Tax=Spirodela intermedia TaxID=51605 RepID=A0A7I8JP05_SPIIN|nr:unnamed protein product [Spirodela intermedia]CAA6671886.1 unnamed protein product [Spirodela intermedia]
MGLRGRSRSYRGCVQQLTPLMEGPDPEEQGECGKKESSWDSIRAWVRTHKDRSGTAPFSGRFPASCSTSSSKKVDLQLTLGVLGCPLAPIPLPEEPVHRHLSLEGTSLEVSSAGYIIQQYLAATGCLKLRRSPKNVYTAGTVKMSCWEMETSSRRMHARNAPARLAGEGGGCFVLWQMSPAMWSVELVVAGCKVVAGSNGKIVWRHLPWLGSHAARGPSGPSAASFSTAGMFVEAQCVGEKRRGGDDCFVLKAAADPAAVARRSEGPAEVIRHVLYGYFSQKSGLLVCMEDSHLARVKTTDRDAPLYWETTIESTIDDYREVDGVLVAHRGRSVATIFRFGEGPRATPARGWRNCGGLMTWPSTSPASPGTISSPGGDSRLFE